MSNLIKSTPSGITNTTSTKSEEKESKMISILSKVTKVDEENKYLFQAAKILEAIGNHPGTTASEFLLAMIETEVCPEDFPRLSMSAVSIEAMLELDPLYEDVKLLTIH